MKLPGGGVKKMWRNGKLNAGMADVNNCPPAPRQTGKIMSKILSRSLSVRDPAGRFKSNTWDKVVNKNRNKRLLGEYFPSNHFVNFAKNCSLYFCSLPKDA